MIHLNTGIIGQVDKVSLQQKIEENNKILVCKSSILSKIALAFLAYRLAMSDLHLRFVYFQCRLFVTQYLGNAKKTSTFLKFVLQ